MGSCEKQVGQSGLAFGRLESAIGGEELHSGHLTRDQQTSFYNRASYARHLQVYNAEEIVNKTRIQTMMNIVKETAPPSSAGRVPKT